MKYIKVSDEDCVKIEEQYDVSVVDHTLAENIDWLNGEENTDYWIGRNMIWKEYYNEYKKAFLVQFSSAEIEAMGPEFIHYWIMKLCMWLEGTVCESFDFDLVYEDDDMTEEENLELIGEPFRIDFSYSPSYGTN